MDDSWARAWIADYGAAWRTGDDEAVAALFADSAVYRSTPFRPPAVGRAAIREYWRTATSTQDALELSFGEPVVQGNRVAVEWWARMLDGGEPITLPGCLVLRFGSDGRCDELREYWHLEQGDVAPPEGWGA
ncbi:MAG TPA: nuclear transport factor 2 family protein [Thermoleophilaceae bacterium]|nr:nuclear transport factor 2 family protein [Thermoleophilaceae bacterium]